ncbi:leucine-rich repeat-containing protein 23-like isoform X1 [Symsagittifera roscoffensis]|uniref:leucine-rich repeat-containing protein 23-like isoform X1 n=1 Tax=Symsagittifera roscoffensis TaxID=84072 RepID=UPI00307CB321
MSDEDDTAAAQEAVEDGLEGEGENEEVEQQQQQEEGNEQREEGEEGEGGEGEEKEKGEGEGDEIDPEVEDPEEVEEDEHIPPKLLTQADINEGISLLCKTGTGLSHAFVRLDIRDKELTDINLLSAFIHLRYIDMSVNSIKDISCLSGLTHLLTLKAEKNILKSAALEELPYLQQANFSHNRIKTTEGIYHPLLETLILSWNSIKEITHLEPGRLTRLHTLELRSNALTSTKGLVIPTLKNLFLAQNKIKFLEDLDKLESLQMLHMRDNQVDNLDGFSEKMRSLQYLNIRGNQLANKKELNKLKVLPFLRAIVMAECPVSDEDDYRIEVLITLRRIERLDKDVYTDEERQEAEEIYEQRRLDEAAANEEGGGDEEGGEGATTEATPAAE